ncbi:MAG: YkgJ family cysteine cluster protein [Candidatus Omnitrophota bacterium]
MIRQFVPGEVCLKCKGCCRFSEEDSIWLPALLDSESHLAAGAKKVNSIPWQGEGFICSFLSADDNECKIYPSRPFECQLYPFLINRKGKDLFLSVDLNCPFAAQHIGQPQFRAYQDYLKSFLAASGQAQITGNPLLFESYEGVRDLFRIEIKP